LVSNLVCSVDDETAERVGFSVSRDWVYMVGS
jgi:hypothetical protein